MQIFVETELTGRLEVTEQASTWRFDSRTPGGWWSASVTLDAPRRELWRLVDGWPGGTLEFFTAGERVWRGELEEPQLGDTTLTLTALGLPRALVDLELWQIFSDVDYANWNPESDPPEGMSADNNNRVYVAGNGDFTDGDEVSVTYPESVIELGPSNIVQLEAHIVLTITSGSWVAEIQAADGTVLWTATTDTTVDVDLTVDTTVLTVLLRKDGTASGEAEFRLTAVAVRTLNPASTDTIAAALLTAAGITQQEVVSGGVLVDRAVYQQATYLEALEELTGLGDGSATWLFTIYDGVAEFRPWSDDADWRLERQHLDSWALSWRRQDVWNAVRGEMPDGWRTVWLTDDDSIALYGRREKTIRLPQTSQAEALTLTQIYLAENAEPQPGIRLSSTSVIAKPDGSRWPAALVRAGDVVVLHDLVPDRQITIQVQEVQVDARKVVLRPRGADSRLEVLLAAMEKRRKQEQEAVESTARSASGGTGGGTTGEVHDPVTLGVGSAAELTLSGQVLTLAEVLTPGEHTALGDGSPHHAAVTLSTAADTLLSLSGQQLGVDAQAANTVYAGPASGVAATPTFRALGASDLALALDELTDVDADTPGAGEVLAWDADAGKWVPTAAGAGNSKYYGTDGAGNVGFHDLPAVVRQTVLTFSGTLAVTDNPLRIYNQFGIAQTISKVFLSAGTAPTGASVIVDVHQDGTTVFTDQGNRPAITSGNNTGESTSIDVATWAAGSYLTVHVDQIGSTVAGSDLVVHIIHS